MDSNGRVTSHLVGLFSRTTNFLHEGLKPIFVFDGKPPMLKQKENERRRDAKLSAKQKFEAARDSEDIDGMKKYAGRTARLDKDMVDEAKRLARALGCPVIEAPSEGEAQAAHVVRNGDAYAVVSQDYDSLLYDTPFLVRNLSVAGKRKLPGKPVFQNVSPEVIDLKQDLRGLGIDSEQLLILAILIGTDYNIGGIKGIGPKKALSLVKEHTDPDKLFSLVEWSKHFEYPWQDVYNTFKEMPVSEDYKISWSSPDKELLIKLLCDEHDFSNDRVESGISGLTKKQKGLGDFF
jgi:flap endonuclease-1